MDLQNNASFSSYAYLAFSEQCEANVVLLLYLVVISALEH